MTTIGFIGLGIMGGPTAANLVKAGFDVSGYNEPRQGGRIDQRRGQGADDVADAVRDADVVITMVPDSPDVEAVTLGENGIFANAKQGALYIDMSSIRPDVSHGSPRSAGSAGCGCWTRLSAVARSVQSRPACRLWSGARRPTLRLRNRCSRRSGRPRPCRPGRCGADRQGRQSAHRRRQHRAGGRGDHVPKAYGVDMEAGLEVLGGGLAGSTVLARKGTSMLAGEFNPGFRLQLHHKDLGIVQSAAREAGVVIPLGAVVSQLVAAMVARGDGGLDHSGLLKLVRELSGRAG